MYCTVGFSASDNSKPEGTLWINAVQFERGETASPYRPRAEVEAPWRRTPRAIFSPIRPRASASSSRPTTPRRSRRPLSGRLSVTDFWGHTVWEEKTELKLQPQQADDRLLHRPGRPPGILPHPLGAGRRTGPEHPLCRDRALRRRRQRFWVQPCVLPGVRAAAVPSGRPAVVARLVGRSGTRCSRSRAAPSTSFARPGRQLYPRRRRPAVAAVAVVRPPSGTPTEAPEPKKHDQESPVRRTSISNGGR